MIRFKLKALIEKQEFKLNRKITVLEMAEKTEIGRGTLSRMLNQKGANTTVEKLDKLCKFFDCEISDLIEYVKED